MAKQGGMTLVELLVVLTIVVLVALFGVPNLSRMLDENRVTAQANDFLRSVHMARAEAIRRNTRVTLCPSSDGVACAENANYHRGWMLFVGPQRNQGLDETGQILRVFTSPNSNVTIRGNGSMARYISYLPNGRSRQLNGAFQAGTVRICGTAASRRIIISHAGRARVTDGDCQAP